MESYEVLARSPAAQDSVFKMLADIPHWQEWGRPLIPRSIRVKDGSPDPNGVGAVRKAGGFGFWMYEEIVEFVEPHRISYVLRGPVPIRRYRATIELEPDVGGGTLIRWRGSFEPMVAATGPLMRRTFRALIAAMAKRVAERA